MAKPQNTLTDLLKKRIADTGPITVANYMAACLGDEAHGYYRTRDPLGARGDFITAPEVSQIFGELIGLWCIVVWRAMGAPKGFNLVELGPGRGTLMADALRAATVAPEFAGAGELHLVETSPVLRAAQAERLKGHSPLWHNAIEDVPEGPAIIIANEFLDALPVRQFARRGDGWRERCVTVENGAFVYGEVDEPLAATGLIPEPLREGLTDGDIAEVRPAADDIIAGLGRRAKRNPLAALLIDYGHDKSAPGVTLQALAAHDYADPLSEPGERDLTAHVDFGALIRAAADAGLEAHGPMEQGEFLLKLGLAQRSERLMKAAESGQRRAIESGARRLADPAQMGSLFKALAVTGGGVPAPPPFRD